MNFIELLGLAGTLVMMLHFAHRWRRIRALIGRIWCTEDFVKRERSIAEQGLSVKQGRDGAVQAQKSLGQRVGSDTVEVKR